MKVFLDREFQIGPNNCIVLWKQFQWYRNDFVSDVLRQSKSGDVALSQDGSNELLTWTIGMVSEEKKLMLKEAVKKRYKVVFKDYNWDCNTFY